MSTRKPAKSQRQIQKELITPTGGADIPLADDPRTKRALNRRVDETDKKSISIGLKDIDETIVYYFDNVIRPSVIQNGNLISVPILYGSPERWSAVQRDGFYRDRNGKIMAPLIMFKRDSVEKNRSLGNKLDANNPQNLQIFQKKYSSKNVYDRFSVLSNREPVKEYYGVVIPDYVNIVYSCVIFTDYVEQMNRIVEGINYASDAYWGDPERFKFRAMIDNYATAVELNKGQDRAVKTTFNINLLGHIIPNTINTLQDGSKKYFSKSRVFFGLETHADSNTLESRAKTPLRESIRKFYETVQPEEGSSVSTEEIIFVSTANTAVADIVILNQATFTGKSFLTPPPGYTIDENSFTVFVNGISVNSVSVTVQEVGSNIQVTFNPSLVGYNVTAQDSVILTGKFK